jgi:hypothetical protein
MVELADTQDLGSCAERCVGSSPTLSTFEKFYWFQWLALTLTKLSIWTTFDQ